MSNLNEDDMSDDDDFMDSRIAQTDHELTILKSNMEIENNEKNKNKSDTIIIVLCEYDDYVNCKLPNLIKELNKLYPYYHYILFLNHEYFNIEKEEEIKYVNPHGILELNDDLIKYYDKYNFYLSWGKHTITGKFEEYILDLYKNDYKNIMLCKVLHDFSYTVAFICGNYDEIDKLYAKVPKYELKKLK